MFRPKYIQIAAGTKTSKRQVVIRSSQCLRPPAHWLTPQYHPMPVKALGSQTYRAYIIKRISWLITEEVTSVWSRNICAKNATLFLGHMS
jgi:hypothetical protein